MAKINEDYEVTTAQEVAATGNDVADAEAAERAKDAGVVDATFIDYAEALENYESRPDVETLAERRAREVGASFRDADFRREIGGTDNAGLVATDTVTDKEPAAVKPEAKKATTDKK